MPIGNSNAQNDISENKKDSEDPFQGLKVGSCLTFRNELSKETHVLTKQEILLGKGARAESSRVRESRRTDVRVGTLIETAHPVQAL